MSRALSSEVVATIAGNFDAVWQGLSKKVYVGLSTYSITIYSVGPHLVRVDVKEEKE